MIDLVVVVVGGGEGVDCCRCQIVCEHCYLFIALCHACYVIVKHFRVIVCVSGPFITDHY